MRVLLLRRSHVTGQENLEMPHPDSSGSSRPQERDAQSLPQVRQTQAPPCGLWRVRFCQRENNDPDRKVRGLMYVRVAGHALNRDCANRTIMGGAQRVLGVDPDFEHSCDRKPTVRGAVRPARRSVDQGFNDESTARPQRSVVGGGIR